MDMITQPSSERSSGRRSRFWCWGGALVAALSLLPACSVDELRSLVGPAATTTTVTAAPDVLVAPAGRDANVIGCADTTGSLPSEHWAILPQAMSAVVLEWASPARSKDGSRAARPGLTVNIRLIGDVSFDPTASYGAVSLARLDGVSAPQENELAESQLARADAINRHKDVLASNQRAVDGFVALMAQGLPGATTGGSEIMGCFSAAAGLLRAGERNVVVAVSDLAQTEAPQQMGRLDGAEVLIVHVCSNAEECLAQEAQWLGALTSMGAESVNFFRPESSVVALKEALLEGMDG